MATKEELRHHMKYGHKQNPLADYLREIIYGGTDGIVTTFAVVSGFSGASLSSESTLTLTFLTVLLFGLANLFADGLSMGLGNFLSIRAERDLYRKRKEEERKELKTNKEFEVKETLHILEEKGFSEQDAKTLTDIMIENEEYWLDWMMQHELEIPNPEGVNPFYTGISTFISFLIFGAIPIIPFILINNDTNLAFISSAIGAFSALLLLGILKWKVIGAEFVRSVVEIIVIGSAAASSAFIVGLLFSV